jgi:hypothetical protein
MSEAVEPAAEPTAPEPKYEPAEDFKAKVIAVLTELGIGKSEPEPAPSKPVKPRSLRQEETDMEAAVVKVLDKMKSSEPPAPPAAAEPVTEEAPGPPPKKRRMQHAIWGD